MQHPAEKWEDGHAGNGKHCHAIKHQYQFRGREADRGVMSFCVPSSTATYIYWNCWCWRWEKRKLNGQKSRVSSHSFEIELSERNSKCPILWRVLISHPLLSVNMNHFGLLKSMRWLKKNKKQKNVHLIQNKKKQKSPRFPWTVVLFHPVPVILIMTLLKRQLKISGDSWGGVDWPTRWRPSFLADNQSLLVTICPIAIGWRA